MPDFHERMSPMEELMHLARRDWKDLSSRPTIELIGVAVFFIPPTFSFLHCNLNSFFDRTYQLLKKSARTAAGCICIIYLQLVPYFHERMSPMEELMHCIWMNLREFRDRV